MAAVKVHVDLPHPIPVVWRALADLASHREWMTDAESIEFVGKQREGIGTIMSVETTVGPLRTKDVMVVTEWVKDERIVVDHTGLVSGVGAFKLTEIPGGTRFEWSEDLRFPWYLGGPVAAAAAAPILHRIWKANLVRLAETLDDR